MKRILAAAALTAALVLGQTWLGTPTAQAGDDYDPMRAIVGSTNPTSTPVVYGNSGR